jgi:hydrogenase nickel incorporation protein HypA/HybF
MPHEVDMTKALIMSLADWQAEQDQAQAIRNVILQVGEFTCVEPALLQSSFMQQRSGKRWLQEAGLIVKSIPFVAHCDDCAADYQPELGQAYACPQCAAPLHHIRSGRELKIEAIEYKDTESSYV